MFISKVMSRISIKNVNYRSKNELLRGYSRVYGIEL
jgi:hypothetical protein